MIKLISAKSFLYLFGIAFVGMLSALFLFLYIIDPYNLWNSPLKMLRVPVSSDHRLVYSSLAVQPDFEFAIIGSSTLRNIDPEAIESLTGKKVVNLAMNSATVREQNLLAKTFLSSGQRDGVVIGIDLGWCRERPLNRKTPTGLMPLWMHDRYKFNDILHLLNEQTIADSFRLVQFWRGLREPKYTANGYRPFKEDLGSYDRTAAIQRIKNSTPQREQQMPEGGWSFPSNEIISSFSKTTQMTSVVLIFVPIHNSYYNKIKSQMKECKKYVLQKLSSNKQLVVLDYMNTSVLTKNYGNFWDVHHPTAPPTRLMEADISYALVKRRPPNVDRLANGFTKD